MEDVVLHYQPGSAAGLGSLLETTEKVLRDFPFRTPPAFSPWFPAAADHRRPIRPAKPPPVIRQPVRTAQINLQNAGSDGHGPERSHEHPAKDRETITPYPARHKAGLLPTDSPLRRSWSVFTQKRVLQRSRSFSRHFHHMVSLHRLHLRQRVRWVIGHHNCGPTRDIEEVSQY